MSTSKLGKSLEKVYGKMRLRSWLCILLMIANFLIAHGAAMYWSFNHSPLELVCGVITTIILIIILSEPS